MSRDFLLAYDNLIASLGIQLSLIILLKDPLRGRLRDRFAQERALRLAKAQFKSVDEYIAAQPDGVAAVLALVRNAIRKALPRAEEVISYKMPAYKLRGEVVIYFAAWKRHYSLYPAGASLTAAFKNELASYNVDKGSIRFPLSEPVPVKLIGRLAKFRAKEAADRAIPGVTL